MTKKREYVIESKGFYYAKTSLEKMKEQIKQLEEKIKNNNYGKV
jgi:predicted transcriptional regulator